MEYVSYSISEARDADGKRKLQKRENKFDFDIKPDLILLLWKSQGIQQGKCLTDTTQLMRMMPGKLLAS